MPVMIFFPILLHDCPVNPLTMLWAPFFARPKSLDGSDVRALTMPLRMLVAAPLIAPSIPFKPLEIPSPAFLAISRSFCGKLCIAPTIALSISAAAEAIAPTIDIMPFLSNVIIYIPELTQLNACKVLTIAWIICGKAAIRSGIAWISPFPRTTINCTPAINSFGALSLMIPAMFMMICGTYWSIAGSPSIRPCASFNIKSMPPSTSFPALERKFSVKPSASGSPCSIIDGRFSANAFAIWPAASIIPMTPPVLKPSVRFDTASIPSLVISVKGAFKDSYISSASPWAAELRIVSCPSRLFCMVSAIAAAAPSQFSIEPASFS